MAKKTKPHPCRDMTVPAMANRNGGGAHQDLRKEADKEACRQKVGYRHCNCCGQVVVDEELCPYCERAGCGIYGDDPGCNCDSCGAPPPNCVCP